MNAEELISMPVNTYTTLDDPSAGSGGTVAQGINAAGQIVGYYLDASFKSHGFLYSGGTYTTLDDPLARYGAVATGINNAGQVVGLYKDASLCHHGFPYTGGTYTTLDDPSATANALALAI